jgi:type I restriction enzyme S subunit
MSDELPQGWVAAPVSEVIEDFQPGFASGEKNVKGGVAHLRMNNIGLVGELVLDLVRTVPEKLAKPWHDLSPGDVLVCTTNSGALVGKCAYFDLTGRYAFSNHITRLRPKRDVVDGRFLRWNLWLHWKCGVFDDKCKHWVNQSTLPKDALLEDEVVVPPLAEQQRIVAKLETLLGKVDACQQRLAKLPTLLKRFRQSVLAAACSGRLTADWREENPNTESAAIFVQRVQEERKSAHELGCAEAVKNGQRKPKPPKNEFVALVDEQAEGLPEHWCIARIIDISDCLDHIRVPINKTERLTRKGTIPYYGANGQVGLIDDFLFDEDLVLVVEDETFIGREIPFSYVIRGKAWVNNHAHVLRPLSGMPVDYLNVCLSYYDFTPLTSGTTGRRKLNQDALLNAPLLIAPLAEQQEIVRRVESLFALAAQLESRLKMAVSRVCGITPSLLARAFAGKLVPQDPADEPAAVLLERIKAKEDFVARKERHDV